MDSTPAADPKPETSAVRSAPTGSAPTGSAPTGSAPTGSATPARAPWRVLLAYLRPHRFALLAGGALSLLTGATGLALPLIARQLIGDLANGRPVTGALAAMTALVMANAAIGAVGGYLLRRTAESVVLTARQGLVARLSRLRMVAVDRSEPGDLMSRVTADTTLLREVTTGSLVGGVTGAVMLVATVVMMGLMDLVLLGVTVVALALAGAVIGVVAPRINRAARRAQESVGTMGAALERMFGAFRTVKASGAEGREGQRVHGAAVQAWQASVRAAKWSALAGNMAGLAAQVAFLSVLSVGGARVASGAIGVGTLVAFLLYVFFLMSPIGQLVSAITQYQVGAAAVTRIQEAEHLPIEPSTPVVQPVPAPWTNAGAVPNGIVGASQVAVLDGAPDGAPVTISAGTVVAGAPVPVPNGAAGRPPATVLFDDVRFRYRPELPEVHCGVSFHVPSGGMTAFVGPSGAGKTTVFSLIERFYEPDAGRILVDGIDIREWQIEHLRDAIGYVEQDAPVLSGTLRENLLFGAPDATEEQVRQVLRTARLDELVARLPDDLDAAVGHRGTTLSGGERQRVAIARALLRRPRLLLLDEATSQLDAVNEAALRATIADVAATTTVLVVAHRLSTVTMADRIVVMDAGRVRAVGTHAQLISADELYAELAATQFLTAPA